MENREQVLSDLIELIIKDNEENTEKRDYSNFILYLNEGYNFNFNIETNATSEEIIKKFYDCYFEDTYFHLRNKVLE